MKRVKGDPVVQEIREIRRKLWKEMAKLTERQRHDRMVQMAREVQEEAGVRLRVASIRPRRLPRMRKSG